MKKLIFATGNENKVREIREIMGDLGYEVISMKEAGIDIDIDETGTTFAENALIKAKAVNDVCHELVLADDSGLEIDCLGKEPGIYSARYLGHDTPYSEKNRIILERLEGVPDEERTARFVCAVAAVFPDGRSEVCVETMEGRIGHKIAGENGFGYDPVFQPDGFDRSMAELTMEEKNAISHRGKALKLFKEEWGKYHADK